MEKAVQAHFFDGNKNLCDIIEAGSVPMSRWLLREVSKRALDGPIEIFLIGDGSTTNHAVVAAIPKRCRRSRPCVKVEGADVSLDRFIASFLSKQEHSGETTDPTVVPCQHETARDDPGPGTDTGTGQGAVSGV